MKTILVPIDFSEISPGILNQATAMAQAFEAHLVLLHVITPPVIMTAYGLSASEIDVQIQQTTDRAREELDIQVETLRQQDLDASGQLQQGGTVDSILESARQIAADCIILGSHGHGAVYNLLVGSTARGVLRQAACPVLIVPHTKRNGASRI